MNFNNARPFEKEGFAFIPAKKAGGGAILTPKFRRPCRYAATETKLI